MRIGIVGVDSSHTPAFTRLLHEPPPELAWLGVDARVVGLYAPDREATAARAEELGVAAFARLEDLLAASDAVMILSRWGKDHAAPAREAIAAGKPLFVDKPLADDWEEALTLAQLARDAKVPFFSCSAFRFAPEIVALRHRLVGLKPRQALAVGHSASDRLTFYAIHATECVVSCLGRGIRKVYAEHCEDADAITFAWRDGKLATLHALRRPTVTAVQIHSEGQEGFDQAVISRGTGFYVELLRHVLLMFRTGIAPVPAAETVEIIAALNGAERSIRTGAPVSLEEEMARIEALFPAEG